ncbi:L,D-transpeptidase [Prauserella marina]|uniref:Lipoprotein-anchoring transpeptidase ErfK/SrfK n=1 Tax=Prauserella marina TaxID=530584 RepID=A0A222VJ37_9PSEU|nr:Ig-like domain-containing protein [Prauserella marina]ASR33946.1 L,D-transpeptidase [Prauserella marina]PWV82549.1 lipoprotein-anchoring transpeptidase ErfK/SrfK [Prauserella marina]SDC71770.1 Lipoprotein-anchoring transpeptidase ErfK/SrfK [Prauserella marina]
MFERRTVFRAAAAAGSAGLLAACSGTTGGTAQVDPRKLPPEAEITAEPVADAKDVPVRGPVTVTVAKGTLTEVKLTNAEGGAVAGELNEDKTVWTSSEPLGYSATYTYAAKAKGTDGKTTELTGDFHTVAPSNVVRATLNPVDHAEVGVAMPISVKFAEAVSDRAAAQRALKVETSGEVEGAWAWLSDRQVDWRPKEYWPANTQVKVFANLYGVHYGGGAYGKADVTTEFTIGRNQVVKVHTPDHRMRVYRDGNEVANYPCSNGKDADPELNTPNGTVIVMSREPTAIFDNERYGYTNVKKKWCCRISNHGEFIHENEDNRANIGKNNTSHGCVNLLEADAKAYFDSALIGDPVEVTGARADFPTTSDVMDWLLDWPTWQSKSAL